MAMNFEQDKVVFRRTLSLRAIHAFAQTMGRKEIWQIAGVDVIGACTTLREKSDGQVYLFVCRGSSQYALTNISGEQPRVQRQDHETGEIIDVKVYCLNDAIIKYGDKKVVIAKALVSHCPD